MEDHWEHFHHSADIGVRGVGRTVAEAFRQAALGLTAVVVDSAKFKPSEIIELQCTAPDLGFLLYEWLNDIVFQMAIRSVFFTDYRVTIQGHHLQAKACAARLELSADDLGPEIKGATFTELRVERLPSGYWVAQCVLDV